MEVLIFNMLDPGERADCRERMLACSNWPSRAETWMRIVRDRRAEFRRALLMVPAGADAHPIDRAINTPEARASYIKHTFRQLTSACREYARCKQMAARYGQPLPAYHGAAVTADQYLEAAE